MPRIPAIDPAEASGEAKTLLDAVQKKLGRVPNLMRTLAHSPAALGGYLALSGALDKAALDARTRERIALAVAQVNGCGYCLSAHSAIATMVGLSAEEIAAARRGRSSDVKAAAALRYALRLLETRGGVAEADVAAARRAGLGDAELAEIPAIVALNVLTNFANRSAAVEVDFPEVEVALAA
jgi:uncharacterized peroxidase-related enzyme